jgi:pimeloyl-ACP methyl ester carboxylesterase
VTTSPPADTGSTSETVEQTKPALVVDGLRINVVTSGEGRPLLLLHGWGGDASTWSGSLSALSAARRVVAIDLPGFGASDAPNGDWSVGDFAALTSHVMDALAMPTADVVGRSFGGRVAIKLAASTKRVNRLVLLNSAGIPEPRTIRYRGRVGAAKIAKFALSTRLTRRWLDAARNRAYKDRVQQSESSRATIGTFKLVVTEDLSGDLERIEVPTLVIAGSDDTVVPLRSSERMTSLVPQAELRVISGAGHQTHLDAPDEFHRLVIAHLEAVPDPGGDAAGGP